MGFNTVYQALKELFPQLDARILKAVAIEHSKDPDGAVESILTEVLPFITVKSSLPLASAENNGSLDTTSPSCSVRVSIAEKVNASDMLKDGHSVCLSETLDDSLASSFYDAKDTYDQPSENTKNEELISFRQCQENGAVANHSEKLDVPSVRLTGEKTEDDRNNISVNHVGEPFVHSHESDATGVHAYKIGNTSFCSNNVDYSEAADSLINGHNVSSYCCNGYLSQDLNATLNFDGHKEKILLDCNLTNCRISYNQAFVSVKDLDVDASASGLPISDGENQELKSYVDADLIQESSATDTVGSKDDSVLSTIVTQSGQICRVNLLEEILEDAKNHKDALFSAMESVITLIKEVEVREKEAQDTKEAAMRGGLDILEKVEELKKILKHAKEANDMHAGEVYGEKSILATELKELQNRLLGLSDEKDKSLSILDEMRETLEARLCIAEENRRAAEQELLEKEELARAALAEQELIMEKVVQESKQLQQEAEENAKLRDFLMDKGRLVDTLQGEISVLCQDVKSLKENFDNHISLSKSMILKQTSCCQSSSNSSVKSMASDVASVQTELPDTPSRLSRAPSVECQSPRSSVDGSIKSASKTRKELLDEDWELFDF